MELEQKERKRESKPIALAAHNWEPTLEQL